MLRLFCTDTLLFTLVGLYLLCFVFFAFVSTRISFAVISMPQFVLLLLSNCMFEYQKMPYPDISFFLIN